MTAKSYLPEITFGCWREQWPQAWEYWVIWYRPASTIEEMASNTVSIKSPIENASLLNQRVSLIGRHVGWSMIARLITLVSSQANSLLQWMRRRRKSGREGWRNRKLHENQVIDTTENNSKTKIEPSGTCRDQGSTCRNRKFLDGGLHDVMISEEKPESSQLDAITVSMTRVPWKQGKLNASRVFSNR